MKNKIICFLLLLLVFNILYGCAASSYKAAKTRFITGQFIGFDSIPYPMITENEIKFTLLQMWWDEPQKFTGKNEKYSKVASGRWFLYYEKRKHDKLKGLRINQKACIEYSIFGIFDKDCYNCSN